jgi:hypothetical protein
MTTYTVTSNDTLTLNDRVIVDQSLGDVTTISFPSELVSRRTGKNGNTIFAKNAAGANADLTLRVSRAKSGAKIVINPAPFKDAKNLKNAIESESARSGVDISNLKNFGSLILLVDSSVAFNMAIAPCLLRCTRNDQKITDETFDAIEARQDYYEILVACVKENVGPLLDGLFSQFTSVMATPESQENAQK